MGFQGGSAGARSRVGSRLGSGAAVGSQVSHVQVTSVHCRTCAALCCPG